MLYEVITDFVASVAVGIAVRRAHVGVPRRSHTGLPGGIDRAAFAGKRDPAYGYSRRGASHAEDVITSYSIHYTKLYESPRLRRELQALTHDEFSELPAPDTVSARVEQHELRSFIHREVERLPEKYRLLISLRYQHELTYDEIASLLDLPLGTVKTGLV